jgi:hypothetical protein
MPFRRSICDPVDPSDRHWVPKYDLDDTCISPEVGEFLTYYLPAFLALQQTEGAIHEIKCLLGRATNELLRVFDFNARLKYDCAAFAHELRVCGCHQLMRFDTEG